MNKKTYRIFLSALFLILLIPALFVSCASTEQRLYTVAQEEGQLIFLRPTTLKNSKSFVLTNSAFDVTVRVKNFSLTDDNTVNYTLYLPKGHYNSFENAELFFSISSCEKIELGGKTVLYKDFDRKKNLEVRYSSTMTAQQILLLLENPDAVQIGVTFEGETQLFKSEDFSQKLYELGVLVL